LEFLIGQFQGFVVKALIEQRGLDFASDSDGFEILRTHDRPGSPSAQSPPFIDQTGIEYSVFPGGSDAADTEFRITDFRPDKLLGHLRIETPEVGGLFKRDFSLFDEQIDRFFRFPLDDDGVVARGFEIATESSSGNREEVELSEGRLRVENKAIASRHAGGAEGPCGENERILGREGVDLGRKLSQEEGGTQASSPPIELEVLQGNRLLPEGLLSQVDPQKSAMISVIWVSHQMGPPISSSPIYCTKNESFSSVTHDEEVCFRETPDEWLNGETDPAIPIMGRLLLETLFIRY
jgi:hypothetical protein